MDNYQDVELFEGKSLADLFKEIYDNSSSKRQQIKELISSLSPLVQGIGDATLLVPLIKEYLEIGVKNDEQLIKLAQIVQRMDSGRRVASGGGEDIWASFASALDADKANEQELQNANTDTKEISQ